jgi:3-hydroxyanthranilate 3,4-dioxygenase
MSQLSMPINFKNWINDNREYLKPPVGNKVVWKNRDTIVMVVGGPNKRTDFHINETEEFFYQVEGDMVLKVQMEGKAQEIPIKEGEIFLLPAKIPHAPQRPAHTIGLVVEQKRKEHQNDGLRWYCSQCNEVLYDEFFHLKDIETQLPPVFDRFYAKEENRTCKKCHYVMPGR